MTIYVDSLTKYKFVPKKLLKKYGDTWAHLGTDSDVKELHVFAKKLGLKRIWFQNTKDIPHYDIIPSVYKKALKLGAIQVSNIDFIELCRRKND